MTRDGGPDGVLSLHIGTNIGWCYGSSEVGLWRLPKTDDHGVLAAALVDALSDHCKVLHPSVVVLSGPPYEAENPMTADAAVLHLGFLMCVRLVCYRRKIKFEVPSISQVRSKMLGRPEFARSGLRDAVISYAKRRGLNTVDVDTAHALVLWEYRRGVEAGSTI